MNWTSTTLEEVQEGLVLLVDKPLDWTSFDAVAKIRNAIRNRYKIKKIKVGHAGTLDPKATGLLIICVGRKTKEIESFMGQSKYYEASIKLGATTPCFDTELEEDAQYPTDHIDEDLIRATLQNFVGKIQQAPPAFSALKKEGKPMYELARKGEEVEMKKREIEIYSLDYRGYEDNILTLGVHCGKGTYIRSLARDLGEALRSGGYLVGLRRTQIGENKVSNGESVEALVKAIKQIDGLL